MWAAINAHTNGIGEYPTLEFNENRICGQPQIHKLVCVRVSTNESSYFIRMENILVTNLQCFSKYVSGF